MKILVIGKNGQLGISLYKLVSKSVQEHDFTFVGRDKLDITNNKLNVT